jgi:hypothetical protein
VKKPRKPVMVRDPEAILYGQVVRAINGYDRRTCYSRDGVTRVMAAVADRFGVKLAKIVRVVGEF